MSASRTAVRAPLIVVGKFNAQHQAWGYGRSLRKGVAIWGAIHSEGFTLLNDHGFPTRVGNSISNDTSPDLALAKHLFKADWRNTGSLLGSDHYIIETDIRTVKCQRDYKKVHLTDWNKFHEKREADLPGPIVNIKSWTETLRKDANAVASVMQSHPKWM